MAHSYLAIDIGGTRLKYALLNRAGTIIEKGSEETEQNSLAGFLTQVKTIVARYRDQIKGVAFSAPGKVDHTDERIFGGGALTYLDKVSLPELLDLDIPVGVENDGKAAALSELWLGNLKEVRNGAALVLGTGVGGGLIFDGKLWTGAHFLAGEVSFITDEFTGDDAKYIGGTGSAVKMIERIADKLSLADRHDGEAVFNAIKAGNQDAVAIFTQYAQVIARLIFNMQAVVDLDRYVLGGGISAQPIVIEAVRKQYDVLFRSRDINVTTLTPAEILPMHFGNDANLYGALYHLLLRVNGEV
jgi:predicted NBD/HSP70 family sugar kinase